MTDEPTSCSCLRHSSLLDAAKGHWVLQPLCWQAVLGSRQLYMGYTQDTFAHVAGAWCSRLSPTLLWPTDQLELLEEPPAGGMLQLRYSPRPCAQRLPGPTAKTWASPAPSCVKTRQLQGHWHFCSVRPQRWEAKHPKTGASKKERAKEKCTDLGYTAMVEISDQLRAESAEDGEFL